MKIDGNHPGTSTSTASARGSVGLGVKVVVLIAAATIGATPWNSFADDECDGGTDWTLAASDGPSGRGRHSVAVDTHRARAVLFGGVRELAGFERPRDTWEWDGISWTLVDPSGPPGRNDGAMAYHAATGEVVLFGGFGPPLRGDTWTWDGTAWTERATSGPSPRQFHAMAYDPIRERTVLFGGWSPLKGDTWEWDGDGWTQIAVAGPSPRLDAKMAWDPARGEIVLHGGNTSTVCSNPLQDTWSWNGEIWTLLHSDGGPGGCSFDMAYDAVLEGMVAVIGDRTWLLGEKGWSELSNIGEDALPETRGNLVMWTDPVSGFASMHGGFPDLADTWILETEPPATEALCECLTADLGDDGIVDGADIAILLDVWGLDADLAPDADLNDDGMIDGGDLAEILARWGVCE